MTPKTEAWVSLENFPASWLPWLPKQKLEFSWEFFQRHDSQNRSLSFLGKSSSVMTLGPKCHDARSCQKLLFRVQAISCRFINTKVQAISCRFINTKIHDMLFLFGKRINSPPYFLKIYHLHTKLNILTNWQFRIAPKLTPEMHQSDTRNAPKY